MSADDLRSALETLADEWRTLSGPDWPAAAVDLEEVLAAHAAVPLCQHSGMTVEECTSSDLCDCFDHPEPAPLTLTREAVVEALLACHMQRAADRIVASPREHCEANADAVLAVAVPAEPVAEFPVATICGSMRFYDRMVKVAERLTAEGVVVLMPFVTVAADNQGDEFKAMLDRMHRQKIDAADRIVVVTDADSPYVGESTNREIQYAAETGKSITWALEPRAVGDADAREIGERS